MTITSVANFAVLKQLAILSAFSLLVGCSAFQVAPTHGSLATEEANPATAQQQPAVAPSMKVEIRAAGESPEFREVQLREGMCIQDALIQTGLTRRFRRMNLELVRRNAQGLAKMDSRYEHQKNRVNPLYDYALHPSDHLVVTEDTTTMLDDMLKSLSLGRSASSR